MQKLKSFQKGIQISSTSDISVLCSSNGLNGHGADAYLALPTKLLGLIYVVASYKPLYSRYKSYMAAISVISAHDNNTITVYLSKNAVIYYRDLWYDNSNTLLYITVGLEKLEALYISSLSDLSGTIIIASKPVSVISGVGNSGHTHNYDFLESSLLPVSLWGQEYLLTGIGKSDIFRILAYKNNTVVETAFWTKALQSGGYVELILERDDASFVNCNEPCEVVQYIRDTTSDGKLAEPSMIILPSVSQFLSYYRVVLPNISKYDDEIKVMIETKHAEGLYINGQKLNGSQWNQINGTNYAWTGSRYSNIRSVTVNHTSPAVKFGLLVFGSSSYASYGYSGGYALHKHSYGKFFNFEFCMLFPQTSR
jgi:hypothetical protein